MNRPHRIAAVPCLAVFACLLSVPAARGGTYPQPSVYPVSWELKFESAITPKRIVVPLPGKGLPQAYWYLTYTITNNTDRERIFLPHFELLAEDGQVIRSDNNVPLEVFHAIKKETGLKFLETAAKIAGEIRLGPDQARDGVAIWTEPAARMGHFRIYVGGLSGETVMLRREGGELVPVKSLEGLTEEQRKQVVILRKTLELYFFIRGDEVFPGEDQVNDKAPRWVMR